MASSPDTPFWLRGRNPETAFRTNDPSRIDAALEVLKQVERTWDWVWARHALEPMMNRPDPWKAIADIFPGIVGAESVLTTCGTKDARDGVRDVLRRCEATPFSEVP